MSIESRQFDLETIWQLIEDQTLLFEDRLEESRVLRVGSGGLVNGTRSTLTLPSLGGENRVMLNDYGSLRIAHIVYPMMVVGNKVARAKRFKSTMLKGVVEVEEVKIIEVEGPEKTVEYWRTVCSDPEVSDGELKDLIVVQEQRGVSVDLNEVREDLLGMLESQFC